ncbi:MFS transporter [Nocardia salmonicida]|uniref:MFS transporter n=1 Tax=Nocardia salmonicida TaxID=53431 RepID=UPI002E2807F0|nr:MFS transporter [Nocardia salmonicida]
MSNSVEAGTRQAPVAMTHRQILEAMTGLLAALFTALLSTTIVATALPTIIGDLEGSQTAYAWVITTALLANAASTPIWGKFADLFNKKLLVQSAIVIFVIGSVIAGVAGNVPMLLAARVIQGIGMGGLTALVVAIIGSIVSPRERGRYSGYMGAVMAVSMSGGPILGGVIVDSPLGWRWCFFVCVPLAVIALVLLQRTLRLPTERKDGVSIDWLGAALMTAGVSVLLIWVSFAGKADYYAWFSRESALYVGVGVVLLLATLLVESRAKSPIIPLSIVTERTTGLAIIASIAVGIGMFGATTFLGQYFQTSRGYSPTVAGVLTIPMVAGMLVASTGSGQLITRFGKWKAFVVTGGALLVVGFGLLSTIDHATNLWLVGTYIAVVGLGVGMMMQNLVLAVQNTVSVHNIGAASSSVAFFRTFGGAIGVSVLGSVLATRVSELSTEGFAKIGVTTSSSGGSNLNLHGLPAPIATIVRAAYGDATGRIFLIAAGAAVVALLATAWLPNRPLRSTIDIDPALDPTAKESASQDNPTDADAMAALDAELAVLADSRWEEDRVWEGAERVLSESELVPASAGRAPVDQNGHRAYQVDASAQSAPSTRELSGSGIGGGAVDGHVRREDGHPLPGAVLTLIDQRGRQVARASSAADGGYAISAPESGGHVLIVSAMGHQPTAVNVSVGQRTQRMDLTLVGSGELSGVVRTAVQGSPLSGATVTVTDMRGEVVGAAVTGGDGAYLCHGVVSGIYTLVAAAEHMRPSAITLTVPDSGVLRHDIELTAMAVLAGSARADGERAVPDVLVTVLDSAGEVAASVRTDENGRYVVTDLVEGQYTVVARGYPPVTGQVTVTGGEAAYDVRLGHELGDR